MKNLFIDYAANKNNRNWEKIISRLEPLPKRAQDLRNNFERDYNRIIHSNAYRRLKHKTQVFFSPENDHICTRIEHVTHVESISHTIANYLGLNTDLVRAIATAHDLGHSPFGHAGERILSQISKQNLGCSFWHEQNGLDFVDYIELLEDHEGFYQNLNLTYAVRDGIISHCGEVNENAIKPRTEAIDLTEYVLSNQFAPFTWEACVVKIADKISYIGRDIEDAISLGILDEHLDELYQLLNFNSEEKNLNNTVIINYLVSNLCENSSPEKGLCFSTEALNLMDKIKDFNYKNIYLSKKMQPSIKYFGLVLNEIYDTLSSYFDGENTIANLQKATKDYPKLIHDFYSFMENYCDLGTRETKKLKNKVIFNVENKFDFCKCIIYYISGMTDNFAIDTYNEIIRF